MRVSGAKTVPKTFLSCQKRNYVIKKSKIARKKVGVKQEKSEYGCKKQEYGFLNARKRKTQ
jgi:hypothetical protein